MNSIAIAYFFETTYCGKLDYLLVADSKNRRLFNSISTYFSIIETNSQRMIYLYYLI